MEDWKYPQPFISLTKLLMEGARKRRLGCDARMTDLLVCIHAVDGWMDVYFDATLNFKSLGSSFFIPCYIALLKAQLFCHTKLR